eukprot:4353863-Amphidinium_carterae.1
MSTFFSKTSRPHPLACIQQLSFEQSTIPICRCGSSLPMVVMVLECFARSASVLKCSRACLPRVCASEWPLLDAGRAAGGKQFPY